MREANDNHTLSDQSAPPQVMQRVAAPRRWFWIVLGKPDQVCGGIEAGTLTRIGPFEDKAAAWEAAQRLMLKLDGIGYTVELAAAKEAGHA